MTENRDFLAEFEELRVETDGIRDALVSNLLSERAVLPKIVDELKAIRKEIKLIDEKHEKKFEELKMQNLELKKEIAEQNLKIERSMKELKNEMLEEMKKLRKEVETATKIPIRQAVLGEWKLVEHEGWDHFLKNGWTIEEISRILKFEMIDGKLKQSIGGRTDLIEKEEDELGRKFLFVEDDHLKTIRSSHFREKIYIQDGRLHFIESSGPLFLKRIYEKI